MPLMFDCFESKTAGESIVRALEVYQAGLEGMTWALDRSAELELETLDEMIESHEEIRKAFLAGADVARFPSELIRQVVAAFEDFAIGLQDLKKQSSAPAEPSH